MFLKTEGHASSVTAPSQLIHKEGVRVAQSKPYCYSRESKTLTGAKSEH